MNRIVYSCFTHVVDCVVAMVRHLGIRIFTVRSNWKLHFSPMPPVFPYTLVLSISFSSFFHDTARFVSIAGIPFLYPTLLSSREFSSCAFLLSFNPLFRIVFPTATISPSTLSSDCFLYSRNLFLALRLFSTHPNSFLADFRPSSLSFSPWNSPLTSINVFFSCNSFFVRFPAILSLSLSFYRSIVDSMF